MPLLVNRHVFSLVPAQAPFFLRPLLWPLCSMLDAKLVAEPLNESLKYVCTLFSPFIGHQYSRHNLQVEDALDKSPTGWFAGGPDPTMADYMMSFGLEAIAAHMPNLLGPKTKAWVERVHERYALYSPCLQNTPSLPKIVFYIDPPSRG